NENPGQLPVEAHRDDVQDVLVAHLRRIVEVVEIFEEELLVVRDLKIQLGAELLLDPLREEPREHVSDVDPARGAAPRVQGELFSVLIPIENPGQVAMAVEDASPEHGVELARVVPESPEEPRCEPLRAEVV